MATPGPLMTIDVNQLDIYVREAWCNIQDFGSKNTSYLLRCGSMLDTVYHELYNRNAFPHLTVTKVSDNPEDGMKFTIKGNIARATIWFRPNGDIAFEARDIATGKSKSANKTQKRDLGPIVYSPAILETIRSFVGQIRWA